ncbi:MAG: hypothetical protein JW909_08380, partial [Planctomycetes bacterium]|nr:hypothetical protein [Planctomycetota bacterium]
YTASEGGLSGAQETRYAYDSRGRLTKETLAHDSNPDLAHDKEYWYYSDGALKATLEQRIEGETDEYIGVKYTRDQLNRVTTNR